MCAKESAAISVAGESTLARKFLGEEKKQQLNFIKFMYLVPEDVRTSKWMK